MLCHDAVYVIRRHGKGQDSAGKLELQIYEGAKNLWVENPASRKSEFYVFYGGMSMSKTLETDKSKFYVFYGGMSVSKTLETEKSNFYVFYGKMLDIYPKNHAHIMIFYATFFLPNVLQPSRAYFLTLARYICFPRSVSIEQTQAP